MQKKKRKHRRRKRNGNAGKASVRMLAVFLMVLLAVLVAIAVLLGAAYLWMDYRGQKALLQKQESSEMQGAMQQQGQELEAVSVSANEVPEQEQEVLEAGMIRYQGETYRYRENTMTFLCMGIDRRGEVKASKNLFKGGQADAMFLLVLNPDQEQISVIGVNRDTMTEVSVYEEHGLYAGDEVMQLALAHAYGDGLEKSCENTVKAVSRLFYDLPIHGYCALNMSVIEQVNDAVGGVEVTIPESLNGYQKGWTTGSRVHLMGKDASAFIMERKESVAQSASERLERQKQYLNAFVAQAKAAMKQDVTFPVKLYTQVAPYMVTDLTLDEVVYLAGQAVSYSFDQDHLHSMQGEVRMGEMFEEFYPDHQALYELILEVFYEKLS